jgi:dipeptidyl aminopeptidase/acylaminoacyl peptidase
VIFCGFVPSDDQGTQTDHLPPLLVLHGSSDENVSLESGREIVNLAHRLGGQAELVVYPEGHRLSTWKEPLLTMRSAAQSLSSESSRLADSC